MCGPSSNVSAMVPGTMHPVMATPTGMAGGACTLGDGVTGVVVDDGIDEMDEDPTDDGADGNDEDPTDDEPGDPTDDSIDGETGDDGDGIPMDDSESMSGDPADDWIVGMTDDVDCDAEGSNIDGADVSFASIEEVAIDSPEVPIDDSLDVTTDDKVDDGTDSPEVVVDNTADTVTEGMLDEVRTDAANDDAPGDAFDNGAVDLDSDLALAFALRIASSLQRCICAKNCL